MNVAVYLFKMENPIFEWILCNFTSCLNMYTSNYPNSVDVNFIIFNAYHWTTFQIFFNSTKYSQSPFSSSGEPSKKKQYNIVYAFLSNSLARWLQNQPTGLIHDSLRFAGKVKTMYYRIVLTNKHQLQNTFFDVQCAKQDEVIISTIPSIK